ncbi:TPA: AAA family ATPase [Citrobacter freundii]|uniref:AAA family ATPase n=1 Tax=Raoultella planticola TaxID=575 RepID=UPI000BA0AD48|nr:AAA family ATPase [Raoultella planticola]OZP75769.1 hypothetical protein CIG23_02850 [Raoultella planticola]HDT5960558.1 AAA family ATPase [Citrobacter freundii]HDV9489226.1 AAA family ATPase [Citrobacter freundii]
MLLNGMIAMNSFSIDNLTIENFRGIPGTLSLDLSAPLTVIYAANGSGKSSVCQAIEWLLTGTLFAVPLEARVCFNALGDMKVSAHCWLGNEQFILTRTDSGLTRLTDKGPKNLTDIKLLSSITPDEIGKENRADVRQRLKIDWLRSSRWLYSSALSLLVDNDHAERRQQIFANILGYGHLIPTKNKLEAYVSALPSDRSLISARAKVLEDISTLAAENTLDPQWQTQFAESLNCISHFAGVEFSEYDTNEKKYEHAELKLAQKEQNINLRQQHLGTVLAGLDILLASTTKEPLLRLELSDATGKLEVLTQEVSGLKEILAGIDQQKQITNGRLKLRQTESERLQRWSSLREAFADYIPDTTDGLMLRQVYSVMPEAASAEECLGRLKAWSALSALKPQLEIILGSMGSLQRQISLIPTPDSLQLLDGAEKLAQEELIEKTAQFESMSTATEQLYILGLDVARKTQSNECPLCHEQQPDHQALLERINTIQNSISPAKEQAFRAVETARLEAKTAAGAHKAAIKYRNDGLQAQRDYDVLNASMVSLIDGTEINIWENENSVQKLLNKLQEATKRAKLACDVNEILALTEASSEDLVIDALVSESLSRLDRLNNADNKLRAALTQRSEELTSSLTQKVKDLNDLEKLCNTTREGLNSFLKSLVPFKESWRFIAGNKPFSGEFTQSLKQQQEQEADTLLSAKAHLEQALMVLRTSQSAKRLDELKVELTHLNDRIQKREKRVVTGKRTLELWTKHVHDIADRSLQQFLTPASELFSKMHANEVYQSLTMGRENDAFCWQAANNEITGSPGLIDAQTHFSQGQRQDLALSLFLARARNLNGSFFLDEPVAHLDDLNRVAMMDIFRMLSASEPSMRLVLTTASNNLRRHLRQKFSASEVKDNLRIITLEGNPNQGVKATYS